MKKLLFVGGFLAAFLFTSGYLGTVSPSSPARLACKLMEEELMSAPTEEDRVEHRVQRRIALIERLFIDGHVDRSTYLNMLRDVDSWAKLKFNPDHRAEM